MVTHKGTTDHCRRLRNASEQANFAHYLAVQKYLAAVAAADATDSTPPPPPRPNRPKKG